MTIATRTHSAAHQPWLLALGALALLACGGCLKRLHGNGPPDQKDMVITDTDRTAVIDALATALHQQYVFPDKAELIDRALHDHLQRGDYANASSAAGFAETLTEHIAAVAHDKHLEVRYFERPIEPTGGDQPPEMVADENAEQLYNNHGVFEVRRIRFNLGYLKLHMFGRPEQATDKLAAAMRLLHDSRALIVDLRDCGGGDPETVTLAESYLVPASTHLIDMYTRVGDVTEHVAAKADLTGPRYPAGNPVFILIGEDTGSGCEAFAYTLQAQKRATVIGARSAGAANFGDPHRLTAHFMAFVPVGRPIDPITRSNWEGVGVTPDLAVAEDKALDVAERRCLQLILALEHKPSRREAIGKRIAELE